MLDHGGAIALVQFSFGAGLFWTGVAIVFYQYLLNKSGERLKQDASTRIFYRIVALLLVIFGSYAAITALFR